MLTQLYCTIDDFCKLLETKLGEKRLIGGTKSKNTCCLTVSEIVTIIIFYHYSGHKNFKSYYKKYVKEHLLKEFPKAPSYSRMIELKREVFWVLALFSKAIKAQCTGISIIDSTALKVSHNLRISGHKTFKGLAKRGKTSTGWFFGFKLHMIINQLGEVISYFVTPGNVSDKNKDIVYQLTQNIFGKLIADRGYIGRFKDLYERGITLIHGIQSNMKNQLMPLFDKFLLKQRGIIKTAIEILKDDFNLEHSRHRSIHGFFSNIFTVIAAYSFRPKKPSIDMKKALLINSN